MQDRIVLGFLLDGAKTGYEIKKMMQVSTSNFFNTSLGSIYPALQKLEKNKMVKLEEKVEKGRLKKIYTITQKGTNFFNKWLTAEPSVFKIKAEALLKIFFFSYVPTDIRDKHIHVTMKQTEKQLSELSELHDFLNSQGKKDFYHMLCLQYAINFLHFIKNMLIELKTKTTDSGI